MKRNGLVLGIIFVIIGLIVLLKSFGLLEFSWLALFKTWPFAFIFIGIGILPIKKGWKGLFYVIAIVACVATMMYISQNNQYGTWRERIRNFFDDRHLTELKEDILQSDQVSYLGFSDSITHVKVNAEFASGEYVFETKSHKKMLRLTFRGSEYTSSVTEDETGGTLDLRPTQWNSRAGNGKIYLCENFNYTFNLRGEKSDVSLNAINLKIDTLNINAEESSTWNVTLSKLLPETHVFIKAHPNASNITLTLPASSGYCFSTTSTSGDTQWNNLQPVEQGKYQSNNFSEAKSRVFIHSNTSEIVVSSK
jgi:hypothetical protein